MKIKLNKIAYVFASNDTETREWFKANAEKWIEVETEHMFENQYNAAKYRIYDTQISEIKDDVRTDEKVVFVQWGGKKPKVKHLERTKIGTYEIESMDSLEYYRLSNARKTINFVFFKDRYYVTNGIGYTKQMSLDVPADVNKKLFDIMKKLHK